jgi:murein DD-endopeptidase MepM/ murein hydrolase activator NlpD
LQCKKENQSVQLKKECGERIHDYGNVNAGKTVFVKWEDGKTAIYGHLNDFTVKNGQHVSPGDLLGHAGNTGFSTGNHLHFGLKDQIMLNFLTLRLILTRYKA